MQSSGVQVYTSQGIEAQPEKPKIEGIRLTSMERLKIRTMLMFITVFMALIQKIMALPPPSTAPPLCLSQFTLVNHACAILPVHYDHMPQSPETKEGHDKEHQLVQLEHEHEHEHEHGHVRQEHESRREHSHSHEHHRHHHHSEIEDDCCRWLNEVDNFCVCEVLLRLPPFLRVPSHSYTVTVGDLCKVTFVCPGKAG